MGVLLQLYIKNLLTCCGYCSPTEDRNAYQAVRSIQRTGRYLIQHPLILQSQNHSSNANVGNNFLTNLFGSSTNKDNGQPSPPPPRLTKPRRVRMMVQDSDADGQPILCIIPLLRNDNASNNTAETNSHTDTTSTTIKLRRIDKVQLDGDQIVFYGKTKKPSQQQRKNHPSGSLTTADTTTTAVELLRFSILLHQLDDNDEDFNEDRERADSTGSDHHGNKNTSSDTVLVSTDTRNTMVHYWMVLVEWERQRRLRLKTAANTATSRTASNTVDDADSDSEETDDNHNNNNNSNNTNFITRHTQKIQHYAQREIELQRTKRQREVRKAQLLSQTNGGLKYTALAMATNEQQLT